MSASHRHFHCFKMTTVVELFGLKKLTVSSKLLLHVVEKSHFLHFPSQQCGNILHVRWAHLYFCDVKFL